MLSIVFACAIIGLEGELVEVQVDFNPRATIPAFHIVGLPDSAVKESRERVRAAIKNSGLQFPNKAYVVNLSPANLPKHGPAYDLAIAVGVLASTDQLPIDKLEKTLFVGELSLDGRVGSVQGVMSMVHSARQAGYHSVVVPEENALEAAVVGGVNVIAVETLAQLTEHLYGLKPIAPYTTDLALDESSPDYSAFVDFADIKGQEYAKRGLTIAAAGGHNLRMIGPPGAGKSLMARALPTILPRLSHEEALEVMRIYSVVNMHDRKPMDTTRPFRAPHHTISQAGLVGGGSIPRPGEISLSHRGVLFLDEINEFSVKALEVMRQPLEDKVVTISRASGSLTFPANFMLVAAHNPCPCGHHGNPHKHCRCTPSTVERYQSRLSGPLLDRIDIHLEVIEVDYDKLMSYKPGASSAQLREEVERARAIQQERFKDATHLRVNADMGAGDIQTYCVLTPEAQEILSLSARKMRLSARTYHRTLKLSRTIADLAGEEVIQMMHVAEAVQYRHR